MTFYDDKVRDEPLTITDDERDSGVVGAVAITYKRLTIVILESQEGFLAVGSNASWPTGSHAPHLGLAAARHHASERLATLRDRNGYCRPRRVPA